MNPLDWTLIARYLEGSCTPEERAAVEAWAAADPAHRMALDEAHRHWMLATRLPSGRRIDAMWDGLASRIHRPALDLVSDDTSARAPVVPRRTSVPHMIVPPHAWFVRHRLAVAIAAGVLVVVSVGVLSRIQHRARLATTESAMREYVTTRGQRATIQLSDGTHLTLAADSRVRIPVSFETGTRDVFLEGEAMFNVVHDAAHPFRVHVKNAVAEDIGTRFNVRSYGGDSAVAVAVAEGAVALGRKRPATVSAATAMPEGVMLHQGEVGILDRNGRVAAFVAPRIASYTAWTTGHLEFIRAPLPDVVQTIGRWYDLDVHIEGRALAAAGTVTATFSIQSPSEMVRMLALAVNARVERHGRTIRLIGNTP